jgi:hypothetical protein
VGAEGFVDGPTELSTLTDTHIVSVFDQSGGLPGTVTMYVNGVSAGSAPIAGNATPNGFLNLGTMPDNNNWLGRSQWNDPVFDGSYDEFRVYNHALSAADVTRNFALGPDIVPEAASIVLVAVGSALLAAWRRRK